MGYYSFLIILYFDWLGAPCTLGEPFIVIWWRRNSSFKLLIELGSDILNQRLVRGLFKL